MKIVRKTEIITSILVTINEKYILEEILIDILIMSDNKKRSTDPFSARKEKNACKKNGK